MKRGTYLPKHLDMRVGQKIQMLQTYVKRLQLFKQYPSTESFGSANRVGKWQETGEGRRLLVLGSKLPDSKMSESLENKLWDLLWPFRKLPAEKRLASFIRKITFPSISKLGWCFNQQQIKDDKIWCHLCHYWWHQMPFARS